MSKKDMDRRKKFILELMGDPIYQPMRKESYMMFWTNFARKERYL